jgi:Zn-dependent metalloprotease
VSSETWAEDMQKFKAISEQVGGTHYKSMAIQPAEYILANGIGWSEGDAITYLSRWRSKGGIEDLRKAIHHIQMLIDHEMKEKKCT